MITRQLNFGQTFDLIGECVGTYLILLIIHSPANYSKMQLLPGHNVRPNGVFAGCMGIMAGKWPVACSSGTHRSLG